MLLMLFAILMVLVFGKMILFAIKMTWGIAKIILTIVLLPLALIGMVVGGLIYLALPLLLVIGIISLVAGGM